MKKLLGFGLMAALFPFFLLGNALGKEPVKMDDVVVTATRTPSTLEKIGGSSVTVITAEEIEAKQHFTVEDILRGTPGVDIVSNGGLGTHSSVFLRGAESKNTLVLIDGIMYNDPSGPNRGSNLADITADNIERIEVVRGPMSVLYGSNAAAGVVNIITKKGTGRPSVYAGGEGGSYGTWKAYGGSSGAIDRFSYSFSASRLETDGFSTASDDNDDIPHNGNTSEDDGWENTTVSGKMEAELAPDFDIRAVFRHQESEIETDDWGPGYAGDRFDYDFATWTYAPTPGGPKEQRTESKQTLTRLEVHNLFFDSLFESNLYYQLSAQNRDSFNADGDKSYWYDGRTSEAGWQGSLNFNDINTLSFGATYFQEEMKSGTIDEKDVYTQSFWVQDQAFFGDYFVFVAGLRYDDHETFGDKVTYRLAPALNIPQTGTTFKGSYATGFRSPSLFELYSEYGSTDLDAEESEGWDVGIEQSLWADKVRFGVTYFELDFDDRIAWDPNRIIPGASFPGGYNQLEGKTRTSGFEAFVQWRPVSALSFMVNYTYNDTEDPDGKRLVRRPLNKVSFNSGCRLSEKLLLNLDVSWTDDRDSTTSALDKDSNSVDTLDSYTLVNLSARYDICDHFQIYGRIDNLFDEEYEEAWSYATPGLSGYIGFKFSY